MAKVFGIKRYIASSLWCLGETYGFFKESRYDAYNHLQEAYELFNTLLPGDHELQRLCCLCGIDLVVECIALIDHDKAVSLARDVEKRCAAVSDDLIHSQSLMVLGMALLCPGTSQDRQEALRHMEHAKLKAVGSDYHFGAACFVIGTAYYYGNRLPEALDALKQAWELIESSNSLVNQAESSLLFSTVLFNANRDQEAWKYLELSLMKFSHLGNQRYTAIVLEYMGYGYLRRGDYLNAYGAYEAAAEKFIGTLKEESDSARCRDNMAKIEVKRRNPGLNVGFEKPFNDKDRASLFYPAVQDVSGIPGDTVLLGGISYT